MCGIVLIKNEIYISYAYISSAYNISPKTTECWSYRNIGSKIYINNHVYIKYEDIPVPTRKKLPRKEELIAQYEANKTDNITNLYFKEMEHAYLKGFIKYREQYISLVKFDEVNRYAQHHAVWEVILRLHQKEKKPKLRNIWQAYCRLYPGRFAYNRMNYAINKAKEQGIDHLIIKNYTGRSVSISPVIDKWILDAMSSGKAYSQTYIYNLVCDLCRQYGYKSPSLTSVKNRCRDFLAVVADKRYGMDKQNFNKMPYKGIEKAQYANDQWQIDGWRLPFYMDGYKTLTLFYIIDAFSGYIVGYHIDYTEHTETILKGIENAVKFSGCLPFEILSDNHSFNKTKEAAYFKNTLEKIGTKWTISENPRYKSLVERSFKTFGNAFCKPQYGYIGEGIKTKNPDGRTSQELIDKYTKSGAWLTEEQIKLIAIQCIESYNTTIGKSQKSRKEIYCNGKQPHAFKIDKLDCLRLFIRDVESIVRRGQITIERGGVRYEFQLNKEQYIALNDKRVRVRYESFNEIYLFDIKTDEYLCRIKRKQYAHGAKANQNEDDTLQYYKHKGLLKGIKASFKQRQIEIAWLAESIDPEAAYAMNAKLTPKNIIEVFEQNGHLKNEAERLGVNLETVTNIPVFSEVQTIAKEDQEKRNKRKTSPFTPKNHTISIYTPKAEE
ncbi:transposase [Tannerella sp. AF04-6]|nr:transposase [Tannerella sp. AF04-6]